MPLHERQHSQDDGDEEPSWRVPVPPPVPDGYRRDDGHRKRHVHRQDFSAPRDHVDPEMHELHQKMVEMGKEYLRKEVDFIQFAMDDRFDARTKTMRASVDAAHQDLLLRIEEAGERMRQMLIAIGIKYCLVPEEQKEEPAETFTPATIDTIPKKEPDPEAERRHQRISLGLAQVEAMGRFSGLFAAARRRG